MTQDQASNLSILALDSVAVSNMQNCANETVLLTHHQAQCLLYVLTACLAMLFQAVRTLPLHPRPSTTTCTNHTKPAISSSAPTPPLSAPRARSTTAQFPAFPEGHRPMLNHNALTASVQWRILSQSLPSACSPSQTASDLITRPLTASPVDDSLDILWLRRLLPLTREPSTRLSYGLASVRVVYVWGLLYITVREMCGDLRKSSPSLTPRGLLSIFLLSLYHIFFAERIHGHCAQ